VRGTIDAGHPEPVIRSAKAETAILERVVEMEASVVGRGVSVPMVPAHVWDASFPAALPLGAGIGTATVEIIDANSGDLLREIGGVYPLGDPDRLSAELSSAVARAVDSVVAAAPRAARYAQLPAASPRSAGFP
jgi:hypothetical protein